MADITRGADLPDRAQTRPKCEPGCKTGRRVKAAFCPRKCRNVKTALMPRSVWLTLRIELLVDYVNVVQDTDLIVRIESQDGK